MNRSTEIPTLISMRDE